MEGVERPELRLGLVLYGGVSLAVYIYGVVVEVQRLLRASAAHEGLTGADRESESSAYLEALATAGLSRATVDIVSGTSAGGINGVLLAKALAVGADVAEVRDLWLDGGEIDGLMHRAGDATPGSLIDTNVYAGMLSGGFGGLDEAAGTTPVPPPPAFDLFVSATHLLGDRRGFRDMFGGEIEALVHRFVFALKRRERYGRDDFVANAPLVKLSRATSAFPVAFQPVKLEPADGLLQPFDEPEGWFADGGILNNKPFTEALEAIFTRSSDRPVRRWLLSVDPDPKASTEERPGPEPGFDQVLAKAVAGIPRYQSIAADLESLGKHNERVRRVNRTALDLERDLAASGAVGAPAGSAYRRLRRRAWAGEAGAQLFAALRPGAEREELDRDAVAAALVELAAREIGDSAGTDLAFEKRRAYYLVKLVGMAASVEGGEAAAVRDALWMGFEAASQALWEAVGDPTYGPGADDPANRVPSGEVEDFARLRLTAAIPALTAATKRIGDDLAAALSGVEVTLPSDGGTDETVRVSLRDVFDRFEQRDALLLPIELGGGLGSRDTVSHAQISVRTARGTGVPPEQKLAGDAVGHFGGFLDRAWRENDLMWGRLDGAEILIKTMLAEQPPEARAAAIAAVQEEIFREEKPGAVPPEGDWLGYLAANAIGDADLDTLGLGRRIGLGARAATVLRRMLHGARQGAAANEPPGALRQGALRHADRFVRGTRFVLLPLRLLAYPFTRRQVARTEKRKR